MIISRGETCAGGWAHVRFNLRRQLKLVWGLFLQIVLRMLVWLHGEPYEINWDLSLWLLEWILLVSYQRMRVLGVGDDVLIHGGDWALLVHKMIANHHLIVDLWVHWGSLIYVIIHLLVLFYLSLNFIYLFLAIFILLMLIFCYYFINTLLL